MKKAIIVLVLLAALIPSAAFADFQIGVVGLYDMPLSYIDNSTSITASDLSYGLEARLKLWIFQAGVSALYSQNGDILAITDLGLSFNIWFMRFGVGVGPIIGYNLDSRAAANTVYWTVKSTFDINLGNLGLGVIAYTFAPGLSDLGYSLANFSDNTEVAVTLMFKLF